MQLTNICGGHLLGCGLQIFEGAFMLVVVYKYLRRQSSRRRVSNICGCIHVGCGLQIFEGVLMMVTVSNI